MAHKYQIDDVTVTYNNVQNCHDIEIAYFQNGWDISECITVNRRFEYYLAEQGYSLYEPETNSDDEPMYFQDLELDERYRIASYFLHKVIFK